MAQKWKSVDLKTFFSQNEKKNSFNRQVSKIFFFFDFSENIFSQMVDKPILLVYNLLIEGAIRRKLIVQNNERGE